MGFPSRRGSPVVAGGVERVAAFVEGDDVESTAVESIPVAALAVFPSVAFAEADESLDEDLVSTQAHRPISPMPAAALKNRRI